MVIFVVTITLASVHLLIQCFTSFSHSSIGRNMLIDLPLHCMTMRDAEKVCFLDSILYNVSSAMGRSVCRVITADVGQIMTTHTSDMHSVIVPIKSIAGHH